MTIRYECTECGAGLKIKDELAGTKGQCPKCKTEFVIPPPDGAATESKSESIEDWLPPADGSVGMPSVDEPDELTEDPTAELFDDFEAAPVFVPDEPDPVEETRTEKRHKRRDRKSKEKKKGSVSSATTARSAQALLNASAEKKRMQSGMPDPAGDDDDNETTEAIKYYGTRLVLPGFGFLLCCYFAYSWLASETLKLPPLGQVSGIVKLDGRPLSQAKISFEPIFENSSESFGSNAIGYCDENGYYELIYSLKHNVYGAVIGDNRVTIESDGSVFVPPRYNMQSELVREVKASNDSMNFDLTGK
jgi:hypothetical protein